MTKSIMKRTVLSFVVPALMFAAMVIATPVAGHATPLGMTMASISGGISCATLAGATGAAAFLAGLGGITLLPAIIGGIGLVAFC